MNTSDYIALAALAISGYAVLQSHLTNARTETARREAHAAQAAAERRALVDQVFLEAHGLADDVRLHGGAADRTRQRAKVLLAEGVGTLAPRSVEELESMLRDLKKARGRVRLLIEETEALLPK